MMQTKKLTWDVQRGEENEEMQMESVNLFTLLSIYLGR